MKKSSWLSSNEVALGGIKTVLLSEIITIWSAILKTVLPGAIKTVWQDVKSTLLSLW